MALNLIKLCVGADTPEDLLAWRAARIAAGKRPVVHTRHTPKRAAEILDGGSLYRVFKGVVLVRQRVLAIETLEDGPKRWCEIVLADELIRTAPQQRRPFQGWRYLEASDAPSDLATSNDDGVPPELARQLRALGAW